MLVDEIVDNNRMNMLSGECFQPDVKILNKLKGIIEEDFKINRDVNKYARRIGVTVYYLNSLTKYYLGTTVYELVQDRVHQEVLFLLRNSRLSIKQITFEIGACDPSYFCRCFKKIMGVTPLAYRRKHM
jgi:AraC-like DNA-binding protein